MGTTTTRSAKITLLPEGFVHVKILAEVRQTLDDARVNLEQASAATLGVRRPVWLDLSDAEVLDPDVRHYYKGKVLSDAFTALAIQVDGSPFGFLAGNIYLRIARPGIPTRLFTIDEDPLPWLKEHLA
ncbi:MAG: hypothetical protein IT285_14095 [Bdellovibrionales bacterium]|nr:hypothetical protein [Bdellovibrionales bacterium]